MMIRTAALLARLPEGEHRHVTIRSAVAGAAGDLSFIDHLQKKFSNQVGFLPRQALEAKIARGQVSIAFENGEPAAYLLGQGGYQGDEGFGIVYQAAVSYDARRRLMGTALVQHFMDRMEPRVRLIGLWCAQDIEANEFWSACGFEPVAARHGSKSRGRVHIFWVGRTARGSGEALRFPRATRGGLMRAGRKVHALGPGAAYREVTLPEEVETAKAGPSQGRARAGGAMTGAGAGAGVGAVRKPSLLEQQRAFITGGGRHICIVLHGVARYVPVAPFAPPDFVELARSARSFATVR